MYGMMEFVGFVAMVMSERSPPILWDFYPKLRLTTIEPPWTVCNKLREGGGVLNMFYGPTSPLVSEVVQII